MGSPYRTRVRSAREASRARIVAAATELVRDRAYAELSVEDVMREAGLGRTIFYRHFADLADLMGQAGREAIDELFEAERALAAVGPGRRIGGWRRLWPRSERALTPWPRRRSPVCPGSPATRSKSLTR